MFGLYNTLLHLALLLSIPLWPLVLFARRRFYHGLWERLGFYPRTMTESLCGEHPIWIHAASVGEVKSAVPLIDDIKARSPNRKILMSTMTATGRKVAAESVAGADGVIYFPLDLPWVVARTFRQFDPLLLVLLETEVWPNAIHEAHRIGIPVVIVSGRLSQRSERRYHRFAGVFGRVLGEISAFGMQEKESAERMLRLGVDPAKIFVTGSLKQASSSLPGPPAGLAAVSGFESRPVVVIGSTHPGEEERFVEALLSLRAQFPSILLVIAPRHPERFREVEKLLLHRQLRYRKRSEGGPLDLQGSEVFLVDSVGELAWIYQWANVVFLGGTLAHVGGHNLVEPARWGKPVLIGPHRANVAELANAMLHAGAAVEVHTKDDILHHLSHLLEHTEVASAMGQRARAIAMQDRDIVARSRELLCKALEPSGEKI